MNFIGIFDGGYFFIVVICCKREVLDLVVEFGVVMLCWIGIGGG